MKYINILFILAGLTLPILNGHGMIETKFEECYGRSVAISDLFAFADSEFTNDVFVYLNTGPWIDHQVLSGSFSNFGRDIDLDNGNQYAIISHAGPVSGAVSVYHQSSLTWNFQDFVEPIDIESNDNFGESLCISGDYFIAGSPGESTNGYQSGAAYIFKRSGTQWIEEAKLLAGDGLANDQFGAAVAMYGSYAVIGAPYHVNPVTTCGAAYVFYNNGSQWVQLQKLLPNDSGSSGNSCDNFGSVVSTDGEYAVIGSKYDDALGNESGAAYVFQRLGGLYTERVKLLASDGDDIDEFGHDISITGSTIIVSARNDDSGALGAGAVFIYQGAGSVWNEIFQITASDAAQGESFGWSVDVTANYAMVGQVHSNDFAAYIYDLWNNAPTPTPIQGCDADNLIMNPGFEDWETYGPAGPPDDWFLSFGNVTAVREDMDSFDGLYSTNITWSGESNMVHSLYQLNLPVIGGETYDFKLRFYDDDPAGYVYFYVRWENSAGQVLGSHLTPYSSNLSAWQTVEDVNRLLPVDTHHVDFQILVVGNSGAWDGDATVYVDSVEICGNAPFVTPTPSPPLPCFHHGDVNLDGFITSGDAQIAFWIALSMYSPTFEQECAADCNGDGTVSAGDSQQIFRAALFLDSCTDSLE